MEIAGNGRDDDRDLALMEHGFDRLWFSAAGGDSLDCVDAFINRFGEGYPAADSGWAVGFSNDDIEAAPAQPPCDS